MPRSDSTVSSHSSSELQAMPHPVEGRLEGRRGACVTVTGEGGPKQVRACVCACATETGL